MKKLFVLLVVTALTSSAVFAGDLGLIEIKNEFQAQAARNILDGAYTRVEQGYLVLINSQQAAMLTRSGIEYRSVMLDVDLSRVYLVYPSEKPGASPARIAGAVEIGMGLRIVLADEIRAGSYPGHKATRLGDLRVEIRYIPKAIYDFFTALEDYPTDALADLVSQDSAYTYLTRLEAFQTRYIWSDSIDAARDWIAQKFLDFGYTDVTTPVFDYGGGWHHNVMAVMPGWAEPDKVIVIGGHYDSIVEINWLPGPMVFAPGADDNASGAALVLELARVLSGVSLRKTVVFMAFSAEEQGLWGSYAAADSFVSNGIDVEAMLNFDMVAYDPDYLSQVELQSGEITGYRDVMADAATRVTSLTPEIIPMAPSSDHYAFYTRGFPIAKANEFAWYPYWHTNDDTSDKLNFSYFTEVIKMTAAAVGVVANSAHPTFISEIIDQGDGQSLEIFVNDCDPDYTLTLHYGTSSGEYPYSVPIPAGQCSYLLDGLIEGQPYFFSVEGVVPDAHPAIYSTEESCASFTVPRTPLSLLAEPDAFAINLNWEDNPEADLSHYRVYRDDGEGLVLYQDNVLESQFIDTEVVGQTDYVYQVSAVDADLNESALSDPDAANCLTFEQGVLVVDETWDWMYLPPQEEQEAYFDSIFADTPYGLDTIDSQLDMLSRLTAGSYSCMFWFDDDTTENVIGYSESTIEWYVSNDVDAFIGGWQTLSRWVPTPVPTDHTVYEDFGVASYEVDDASEFVGAVGQDGWPSVSVDNNNPWNGKFPYITALTPRPGATVIYTFGAFKDTSPFEGQPCGLLYQTDNGIRIVLGFPVYFLEAASSEALIQYALELFGGTSTYVCGDANGDGVVTHADVAFLIEYLHKDGPAPDPMEAGDADGDGDVDKFDAKYLIEYLHKDGPAPVCP